MTADYEDGANIIDVQSADVFKKILQENPHVNVIFYTGDWEQSYRDAFSYQYRCYSILYPRMKFCRVRKDCFEVTDNILLKFGFHPEEHIETTGAWGIKDGRKDSETGNNLVYFGFCNELPVEHLPADISRFQAALDRLQANSVNNTIQV